MQQLRLCLVLSLFARLAPASETERKDYDEKVTELPCRNVEAVVRSLGYEVSLVEVPKMEESPSTLCSDGSSTCCDANDESELKSLIHRELDAMKNHLSEKEKKLRKRSTSSLIKLDGYRLEIHHYLSNMAIYQSQVSAVDGLSDDFTRLFLSGTESSLLALLRYFRLFGLSVLRPGWTLSWGSAPWHCDTDLCVVRHFVLPIIDPNYDSNAADPMEYVLNMSHCFDEFIWMSARITASLEELANILELIRTKLLFLCKSCRKMYEEEIVCPLCRARKANTCKIMSCFEKIIALEELWDRAVQASIDVIGEIEKKTPCPCIRDLVQSTQRIRTVGELMNSSEKEEDRSNYQIAFRVKILNNCCNTSTGNTLRSTLLSRTVEYLSSDSCETYSPEVVANADATVAELFSRLDSGVESDISLEVAPNQDRLCPLTSTSAAGGPYMELLSDEEYLATLLGLFSRQGGIFGPVAGRWCASPPSPVPAISSPSPVPATPSPSPVPATPSPACLNATLTPVVAEVDEACSGTFYQEKTVLREACCGQKLSQVITNLNTVIAGNCETMSALTNPNSELKCGD